MFTDKRRRGKFLIHSGLFRQNEKIKDTRVIMLTASGKKRDLFEAEGISDYITKPFDSDDFISRVAKALS